MNISTTCAILALIAFKGCSAFASGRVLEARAGPIGRFYIEGGDGDFFRQNVPEDGNTYPITKTMEVYSIISDDAASNCTFVGADGTPIVIAGSQQDITPQTLFNVTCIARTGLPIPLTYLASFFPPETDSTTASVSSATGSTPTNPVSNSAITTVPPYPTATGSSRVGTGTGGASASTAPSASQATGDNSNITPVPFTGDAVRAVRSIGGPILVFMGLIAAL